MKKVILPMILLLSAAAGCEMSRLDDPERNVPIDEISKVEFRAATARFTGETETKTSLSPALEVFWSGEDEITVFAKKKNNSRYVLKSGSGSRNGVFQEVSSHGGKTLTAAEGAPAPEAASSLKENVALYPYSADAVLKPAGDGYDIAGIHFLELQHWHATSFAEGAFPMIAVSEDNNLSFMNLGGVIRFNLSGTDKIRTITLRGNAGELLAGACQVITDASGNITLHMLSGGSRQVVLDCGTGVQLTAEPQSFHIAVPPVDFTAGFTVIVETNDGRTDLIRASAANTIGTNQLLEMPPLKVDAQQLPEELSTDETANCYLINRPGVYRFRADVKGNGNVETILGSLAPWLNGMASAEVLWESFGTVEEITAGSLISKVSYADGYVTFTVSEPMLQGNAVIAVKDKEGKILWSWHIWLLAEPMEEHVHANGMGTLMDRNLGATSVIAKDVASFGLLYQWGRKDPFLGSGSATVNTIPVASTITWPEVVLSDAMTGTVDYTVAHPTVIIRPAEGKDTNNDWYYTGYEGTDERRWHKEKSIYDPCPSGWRVPEVKVWTGIEAYGSSFRPEIYGAVYPPEFSGKEAWYPATGYIVPEKSAIGTGSIGSCWSVDSANAAGNPVQILYLDDKNSYMDEYGYRSEARSVRCQKMIQ